MPVAKNMSCTCSWVDIAFRRVTEPSHDAITSTGCQFKTRRNIRMPFHFRFCSLAVQNKASFSKSAIRFWYNGNLKLVLSHNVYRAILVKLDDENHLEFK